MLRRGDKFKCDNERRKYTVQAADARFVIATKPSFGTYIYTITDLDRGVRGACNSIFGPPSNLSTEDGAAEALRLLQSGSMEVSSRNFAALTTAERKQLTL